MHHTIILPSSFSSSFILFLFCLFVCLFTSAVSSHCASSASSTKSCLVLPPEIGEENTRTRAVARAPPEDTAEEEAWWEMNEMRCTIHVWEMKQTHDERWNETQNSLLRNETNRWDEIIQITLRNETNTSWETRLYTFHFEEKKQTHDEMRLYTFHFQEMKQTHEKNKFHTHFMLRHETNTQDTRTFDDWATPSKENQNISNRTTKEELFCLFCSPRDRQCILRPVAARRLHTLAVAQTTTTTRKKKKKKKKKHKEKSNDDKHTLLLCYKLAIKWNPLSVSLLNNSIRSKRNNVKRTSSR